MSVALEAVSLAAFCAAEAARGRPALLRLFIIPDPDEVSRIDNSPLPGQRFPYSVSAYCSDQQDGDWMLTLLSLPALAAGPRAGKGDLLDFSGAGYRKRLRVILTCTT